MGNVETTEKAQPGSQGQGSPGGCEGRGHGGPTGRQVRSPPGQIQAWKKTLVEGASGVFGNGKEQKGKSDVALIARLYQEIGQIKVERDFLSERYGP